MRTVTTDDLKGLYRPPAASHKGQNGRLLVIGGSHLFHAASLWALNVASRIVDLVHYSSVPENNELVEGIKKEFRNGIVVPRADLDSYIHEDDCILIGPGMVREETRSTKSETRNNVKIQNLKELEAIHEEGRQTRELTNYLLAKYPDKQWVIDAGALQMMDTGKIPKRAILTPHRREFAMVFGNELTGVGISPNSDPAGAVAHVVRQHHCIVLLKGERDIAGREGETVEIAGGNAGMTKGGTGDVLAGLIAALACKNDPFLATVAGSLINKQAGDALFSTVGPYFNATDLATQIPKTMKELLYG